MTLEPWLAEAQKILKSSGITSARLDALLLLEDELEKSRSWVLAHPEFILEVPVINRLDDKLTKRARRLPLAYILGVQEFYGRSFKVTPDVLIPRPESEAMIGLLKQLGSSHEINTVIDIGTGSGILAITAALELPGIHVSVSDISEKALKIAKQNARNHSAQIRFYKSDLLDNLPNMPKTRPYVVLANLPYVPESLVTSPEINSEPKEALFSGKDGLTLYRRFWQHVAERKNKPFAIITESLEEQHAPMEELATTAHYRLEKVEVLAQLFVLGD
jgi:release factor glutamine methyltransferase